MTGIHSTEAPIRREIAHVSTEVEDAGFLLNSYMQLLFDANQYTITDAEQCGRACSQIYALLVAARVQVDRLQAVPDALMRCAALVPPDGSGGTV